MGIIERKKAAGELVLYHDYRSRSFRDYSDNSNVGTPTDVSFTNSGIQITSDAGAVRAADSASLQLTNGTLVIFGYFRDDTSGKRFISKRDAGSTNWDWYIFNNGVLSLYDGAAGPSLATTIVGTKYHAINLNSGSTPEGFVDGVSVGNYSSGVTITADDAPLDVGNLLGSTGLENNEIRAALIFNAVLTASEHAELFAELESMTWPSKADSRKKQIFPWPSQLVDADMENSGVSDWGAGNSAILTKEASTRARDSGTQVLRVTKGALNNPYAFQDLTTGNIYKIRGWARGDGSKNPWLLGNSGATVLWTGTSSTEWQYFDVTLNCTAVSLRLTTQTVAAGYSEWDDIQVLGPETPLSANTWRTDWGVKESVANVTAGYLENSPFQVISGTWKISADTIRGVEAKVIECVAAGALYIPTSTMRMTPTQAAYGTNDYWLYIAADGAQRYIYEIDDKTLANKTGYSMIVTAAGIFGLQEWVANNPSNLFYTAVGTFVDETWTRVRQTRSSAGVFTFYLDSILATADFGTNPITDTTSTTVDYLVFQLSAGDKVAYADIKGDHSIVKCLDVV
jgi:hypothetical protein